MHTTQAVDEHAYLRYMENAALPWPDEDRRRLQPLLDELEGVIARLSWRPSKPLLLIRAKADFEDGLPHTRANAIVLTDEFLQAPPPYLAMVLAHELFHIISRADPALRERLYAAIGFRPCATVEIPPEIAKLRLSNPDAPEHRHSIAVRYRGRDLDAMPYPRLASETVDPTLGFRTQVRPAWLLVERRGQACKALEEADTKEMEGLFEQIGRNTRYLWHPEEILADNFALIAAGLQRGKAPEVASPEVLDRLRPLLLAPPLTPHLTH
jgi:hypothetical protein